MPFSKTPLNFKLLYLNHTLKAARLRRPLRAESKKQISENIPLYIGPSSNSGTNYLQVHWGLSPVNKEMSGKEVGKC
jgi:hypothetical protein